MKQSHKSISDLQKATVSQVWEIYKLLAEIQELIIKYLGDPPSDIFDNTKTPNQEVHISQDFICNIRDTIRQAITDSLKDISINITRTTMSESYSETIRKSVVNPKK